MRELRGSATGLPCRARLVALAVAVCTAVGGCSSSGDEQPDADPGSVNTATPPMPPEGSQGANKPGQSDDHGGNAAAAVASHEDTLRQFAEAFGIEDPPDVEPIRVVDQGERGQVMSECLTEAGFPVTLEPDGTVGMEFASPDQMSAYDLAVYVCMAQYPLDPRLSGELTDAQLRIYYDWLLEHPVVCMHDRGHPVADPPTPETFIATYRARGELHFFADGLPPGQEADIMSDVLENCEIEPPLEVLFPD